MQNKRKDHSTKIASSGILSSLLLLPHLPVASVLPLLPSSLRFHALSKMQKTLGPFVQKVLRPPAGTPRRPTGILYCILQLKLASGLTNPWFFNGFREAPKRPPGGPQEAYKRAPCGHTSKRPPRGPQEAPPRSPRGPGSKTSLGDVLLWGGSRGGAQKQADARANGGP